MIKIVLKHFIYEKCIDVLFNNIWRNFAISDGVLKAGSTYREIQFVFEVNGYYMFYIMGDISILSMVNDMISYEARYRTVLRRPHCSGFVDTSRVAFEVTIDKGVISLEETVKYEITRY